MERRKVKNGEKSSYRRSLLFFVPYIFSRPLIFPSSPLSAPGSPRMGFSGVGACYGGGKKIETGSELSLAPVTNIRRS